MISLLPAVVDNANASARNYALVYSLRYITLSAVYHRRSSILALDIKAVLFK